MTNIPLKIPPGFCLTASPNGAQGRFIGGDKVRFVANFPEKWKGWETFVAGTLEGIARGMVSWTNAFGNINVAIGTNVRLYAIVGDDTIEDITPIRASSTINNNPFATTSGQSTVTVTDTNHGADAGDYVTYSGATAVAGLTLNHQYLIQTKIDANSYTINAGSNANASTSGGGAAVVAAYNITTGSTGTVYGLGWGAGHWSESTWSTPRTQGIALEGRIWSLQGYGNALLSSPSGGTLYFWDESTSTAQAVANAPSVIRSMFVTGERFVFALGTSTAMTIDWPDVDDFTDWTPSAANTANTRKLQSGNRLMTGTPLTDGVNLVWSDTSLYVFQKVETDFIYDSRLAGDNAGLIGPKAFVVVAGVAYWMASQGFFQYAGSIQQIQNYMDVQAAVYEELDFSQAAKIWGEYDQPNNQVRFHYCSVGATEPDKYVDVELTTWAWTTGTFDGTTGTRHRPSEGSSLFVDSAGGIFSFNVGHNANGAAMASHIDYGLYAITRGEENIDFFNLYPDVQRQVGNLTYDMFSKNYSDDASNLDDITKVVGPNAGRVEARGSGRFFGMSVTSNIIDGDYRLMIPMLEIEDAGARP